MSNTRIRALGLPCVCCLVLALATDARAQIAFPGGFGNVAPPPGVMIDANGHVSVREGDEGKELTAMRARARDAAAAAKDEKLAFVSLPRTFARARAAIAAGQP